MDTLEALPTSWQTAIIAGLFTILGGLIASSFSFFQNLYLYRRTDKKEEKRHLREMRESLYKVMLVKCVETVDEYTFLTDDLDTFRNKAHSLFEYEKKENATMLIYSSSNVYDTFHKFLDSALNCYSNLPDSNSVEALRKDLSRLAFEIKEDLGYNF